MENAKNLLLYLPRPTNEHVSDEPQRAGIIERANQALREKFHTVRDSHKRGSLLSRRSFSKVMTAVGLAAAWELTTSQIYSK